MLSLRRSALRGLFSLILAMGVCWFVPTHSVSAQIDTTGLRAVGAVTGLSATDPRVIAARIINISLGFLAIIMVVIVLYAGFLWMTSGGENEKVEKAQKYIKNAVIGLIIILSSWAIATYVINKLLSATQGDGGGYSSGGPGGGGFIGSGAPGSTAFQVRSITPSGSVPIRNVQVRILFSRDVDSATAASNIQILQGATPVDGRLTIDGSLVTFTPSAACPAPYADRRCFAGNADFTVRVNTGLRSVSAQGVVCGGFAASCTGAFHTGDLVDVTGPSATIRTPFDGQSISVDDLIPIGTHASDDTGISVVESFEGSRSIGRDAPATTSVLTTYDATVYWDTRGVATGTRHTLFSRVFDIDSNVSTSTPVTVIARAAHCFNGARDRDETGLDCGGSECGACSGGSCTSDLECAGSVCRAGVCVEQPIITSITPPDGRVGTFVSITGVGFGSSPGRVQFGSTVARAPAACTLSGASTWTPTQVIVEVPAGAVSSPIRLDNASTSLFDVTNDGRGPRLDNFIVNTVSRPGLCAAVPDHGQVGSTVNFPGTSLGSRSASLFFNDRPLTSFLAWTDTNIRLSTPVWQPSLYAVRVSSTGLYSNAVNYRIDEREETEPPVIDSIDPVSGPISEYITLHGHHFGDRPDIVRIRSASGDGLAEFTFPPACGTGYWRDDTIVFKVPASIRAPGGLTSVGVTPGVYQVSMRRLSDRAESPAIAFTVNTLPPRPGLCAIQPAAGPVNTAVQIYGDRLGTSGSLRFAQSGGTRIDATIDPGGWSTNVIRARVPAGATTGFVNAEIGSQTSNSLSFQVRNCHEDPLICRGSQICCESGACSSDSGVCPAVAVNAHYAWRTSTGIIPLNPEVVEECNSLNPPSPSPWSARTGGDRACLNADVIARFNTRLDPATVTAPGNFVVRKCTTPITSTSTDPCLTSVVVPPRTGYPVVRPTAPGALTQYVRFRPATTWDATSTYMVTLSTRITSERALGSLPMLENRPRCGAGNAYCFRFSTRSASEACVVGSVSVAPNPYTATDLGEEVDYEASPRPADDICTELDGSAMPWRWSVSDGRASISHTPGVGGSETNEQTGTALAETGRTPVGIIADLLNPGFPTIRGTTPLYINLTPPRVEAYGPNCDTACVNALLWVRFNVGMDLASFTTLTGSNIILKQCLNESCRDFDATYELSDLSLTTAPGAPSTSPLRYLTAQTIRTAGGIISYDLQEGRFYKAILRSSPTTGIRSRTLLPLTGLNDPEGFSWTFRVKTGESARCSVNTVTVMPAEKYETVIGARQMFVGQPMGSPDACNENGQPLVSDRSYNWTTSLATVANFFLAGRIDTTSHLTPHCNGSCLKTGSDGVVGKVASCGDGVVQTVNGAYCRTSTPCTETSGSHPACVHPDTAQPCHLGDTGCVEKRTRFGDWCVVLPAADGIGGEECDLGPGRNTPSAICGTSCLWNPQLPITPTSTGRTCGNGTVERGEQCDPGRSCVAGTNLGISCTSDTACGTGGVCAVAERRGCSASCQALGAASAGSTCGNGDIADGETCDIRGISAGHGCSSDCRNEGSRLVTSLCGNGVPEPGESCERTGVLWPAPGCNPQTCLKTGTESCGASRTTSCCGNRVVEAGEDCDGGEGCTARCLLAGSSPAYTVPSFCGNGAPLETGEQCEAATAGDTLIDQRQLAYIVGSATPDPTTGRMQSNLQATYDTKVGQATYGLQCGFSLESSCPSGTGLTDSGCCAPRPALTTSYPPNGATDVCRNVLISGTFPMPMSADSFTTNFVLAEESTSTRCAVGSQAIEAVPYVYNGLRGWFAHLWHSLVAFVTGSAAQADGNAWCVGGINGQVTARPEGDGTKVIFSLRNALKADTRYHLVFRGDPALRDAIARRIRLERRLGIKTSLGVLALPDPVSDLSGRLSWTFTTGRRICAVNQVRIRDTTTVRPYLFMRPTEGHQYEGSVNAIQNGAVVPLSSVAEYAWSWAPWVSSEPSILTIASSRATDDLSLSYATPTAQTRNGSSLINARITITRDTVQIPSTLGHTVDASRNSTVILCERPWPSMALAPFADAQGSPSLAASSTLFASGPFYNFSTLYCRDAGNPGPDQDLPNLTINPVPLTASDRARGILRQYLFSYEEDALKQDGIGIRVVSNPLHLSPGAWYRAQGFTGTPESTTVDGYDAVRDGSTVYVASVNVDSASSGPVTSTIYVISRNPDASPDTVNIYNQLLSNWSFNINLRGSPNVCVTATGVYHTDAGAVAHCTADWECLQIASGLHCESFKPKMQRDTKRIADFQTMTELLEQTRLSGGSYPLIDSGTFVQTVVTSRWSSWQSVLGGSLQTNALPIDPINRFMTCGRCRIPAATGAATLGNACIDNSDCPSGATCDSVVDPADASRNGYDPATCWNAASHRFLCPVMDARDRSSTSRVYQYRAVDGGSRYELSTELEGPTDRYQPPLTTEISRCSNTHQVCHVGQDCIVRNLAGATVSTGTCNPTGGRWNYAGLCTGGAYGTDDVCGNGVVGRPREVCELGDTLPTRCVTADGRPGTKLQMCSDCRAWIDGPSTACVADSLCGNGRIDNYRCYGGAGYRYGQACNTPTTGRSEECSDSRDPSGVVMSCQSVDPGHEEVCDDGAQNGTYGHCNTSCSALTGSCGDGMVSGGELCDNGSVSTDPTHPANGSYCGLPGSAACSLDNSCGYDCRTRAPHCGDRLVQTPEQCDGGAETTASAICLGGDNNGRPCTTGSDCPGAGASCGGAPGDLTHNACVGTVGRCTGPGRVCSGGTHPACTVDGDCSRVSSGTCVVRTELSCTPATTPAGAAAADAACGAAGHCAAYATQHSRACGSVGNPDQCTWGAWSACLPVGRCGDGHIDTGEDCDDGNADNNDSCTNTCTENVCGDGFVRTGAEECDYGSRNGTVSTADYGATVISCSTSCRQVPSSGGYCGDNTRNGAEQCDGDASVPSSLTCSALGYDYAATIKCAHPTFTTNGDGTAVTCRGASCCCVNASTQGNIFESVVAGHTISACLPTISTGVIGCRQYDATTTLEHLPQQARSACTGPIGDVLTCNRTCGYSGCLRCQDDPGDGRISAKVFDAMYSNQPVPNARVTLSQSGRRVAEAFTDANGRFTFDHLNTRPECSTYRIVVDSYVDNPCTGAGGTTPPSPTCNGPAWPTGLANEDEGVNGGYWPFESDTFNIENFASRGLHNSTGTIYMAPKVGPGETLVVLTWNGVLPSGRFLDSHLILPRAASYRPASGDTYAACSVADPACRQDVYYGSPGNRDNRQPPYARLFCYHANGTESCGSFDTAPETMRYRRSALTGEYGYYVVDYSPTTPTSSYRYYPSIDATVRVITYDNPPFVIRPPSASTPPACTGSTPMSQGKYWYVFKQDALSGAITIPGTGTGQLQCTGSTIDVDFNPGTPRATLPGPLQAVGS